MFPQNALLDNCFVLQEPTPVISINTVLQCSVHIGVRHSLLEAILELCVNRVSTTEVYIDSWIKFKSLSVSELKFKNMYE